MFLVLNYMMQFYETSEFLNKLNSVLNKGLTRGIGEPEPGKFCAEAAISYVLGEGHNDRPSCVHVADRALIIKINDNYPGTNIERANALRPLLLEHIGTVGHDRTEWLRNVSIGVIKVLIPIALTAAANIHSNVQHKCALLLAAQQCSDNPGEKTAHAAEDAAAYAAYATSSDADCAAASDAVNAAAYAVYAASDIYAESDVVSAVYASAAAAASATAAAVYSSAFDARRSVYDKFIQIVLDAYKAHPHR